MTTLNIFGMTREQCREVFLSDSLAQHPGAHTQSEASADTAVKSLFANVYRDPAGHQPARLPKRLLQRFLRGAKTCLSDAFDPDNFLRLPLLPIRTSRSAADGSLKILFALSRLQESVQNAQELYIESVVIPERGRLTLCVSSQVGCAQGCRFCQTGSMGLLSQLSAAEIVAQVVWANAIWHEQAGPNSQNSEEAITTQCVKNRNQVTNIVFMGMGEPLDNADAVLDACRILSDPWGLGIGQRKITISTVGLPAGIAKVLTESPFQLALSLHSPFDEERTRMMPVNLRYPVKEILAQLAAMKRPKDKFFIQYTLIRNVNDSLRHASELARLLSDLPVKVNLIPLNEHSATAYRRPNFENVTQFQSALKSLGIVTTVRFSKGRDIQAACGQLVKEYQSPKNQGIIRPLHAEESSPHF